MSVIHGVTNPISWLIMINEPIETVKSYLEKYAFVDLAIDHEEYDSSQYSFHSFLTLQHETVHFWQGISTRFLFFFACDYWGLCLQTVAAFARSNKQYSDIATDRFIQEEFRKLRARLHTSDATKSMEDWLERADAQLRSGSWHRWQRHEPPPSITNALHVIEGAAALCSYRICYARSSHEDFLRFLNKYYQRAALITYGHAYMFATSILGELAFDIFAPACYLALQAEDPGSAFDTIILYAKEHANSVLSEQIIDDPLTFLLNAINRQEDNCFPLVMKYAMTQGLGVPIHSILQPYIERIAQASNNLRVCDFFARPYFYLSRSYSEVSQMQVHTDFFADMLPPAHIYTDNVRRVLRTGLARRLEEDYVGEDYVVSMVRMAAIVGLAERLFGIDDQGGALYNEMSCPYTACPIYKTRLCHRYFAYPDDDFRKCEFPDILKALKLESLLESIPGYL
jgi:hypothetical protein